MLAPR
jgi:hypothetical protein